MTRQAGWGELPEFWSSESGLEELLAIHEKFRIKVDEAFAGIYGEDLAALMHERPSWFTEVLRSELETLRDLQEPVWRRARRHLAALRHAQT